MIKEVFLENLGMKCKLQKKKGVKRINLSVLCKNNLRVTIPWWISYKTGLVFVNENVKWIMRRVGEIDKRGLSLLKQGGRRDYLRNKEKARRLVLKKIEKLNSFYGFDFNKVAIRNQRTCWGSCSSQRNLNFNYRIVYLSDELADYLIVHELCHLKELNHSKDFWLLVKKMVPNYRELSRKIKRM